MKNQTIIGIDLGGTNIRGGWVKDNILSNIKQERIDSKKSSDEVLQQLFSLIDSLMNESVKAIGIGVPGLVDAITGVVYDVVHIPSWKEIPLQQIIKERYGLQAIINNDANCFALGEFYFGKGKGYDSMVGLTIGTGLGSGLILNEKLYSGRYGGAGEFGMMEYKDHCFEFYASGEFFKNVYGLNGEEVFKKAKAGDVEALKMYEELGFHLGNAIKAILFALDVELIILGGSVRNAFSFFSNSMWKSIQQFPYKRSAQHLKIEVSELSNSGILGAAALHLNQLQHS